MKNSSWLVCILWFLLAVPNRAFATEQDETALGSGTYFPTITITDRGQQIELPLKVTITSESSRMLPKKQVGIDGRNFEYDKQVNLKGLDEQQLAKMGEIHFWSLTDGKTLAVDEIKVETLDNVESRIIFYNFEKNVTKTVHAFKSGDEIHGNKKYSHVKLQKYENLKGDGKERPWSIEYRTMLTYIILFLTISPVFLVIALIIFVYLQTEQLDKIARKKKIKERFLWLLLPALFTFGIEASANDYDLQEVRLTQEKAAALAEEGGLEEFLVEKSGIQHQITHTATIKMDIKQMTDRLNQPREQMVRVYQSRSLKVGDHENTIIPVIALYSVVIVLPLTYFFNQRLKNAQ